MANIIQGKIRGVKGPRERQNGIGGLRLEQKQLRQGRAADPQTKMAGRDSSVSLVSKSTILM